MVLLANGINGFLGSRASLMLDVVFLAMFAVLPVMAFSIRLVKQRQQYASHKRVQLILAVILLVAVAAFEIDMRFFTDWRARAVGSPYYTPSGWCGVWASLIIHLACAIPTLVIWTILILAALKKFPQPPQPSAHSQFHRRCGWLAAIFMTLTSVTGWVFYYLAFVATSSAA